MYDNAAHFLKYLTTKNITDRNDRYECKQYDGCALPNEIVKGIGQTENVKTDPNVLVPEYG